MNNTSGLFESLPTHTAPERAAKSSPRLRTAERNQIECVPVCLDELIPLDHRVRQVWKFVQVLKLGTILSGIKSVEGHPGRPSADPKILVALWLYATVIGIASAREVSRLCKEHIAFRWLCGGVGMNAKTLADFRVDHGEALEQLLIDSFAALVKAGVASLDRTAQDGVRVRASAGSGSFRRERTLEEYRAEAAKRVQDLRAEAQKDPGAGARKRVAAQKRGAEDRERRITAALALVRELQAEQDKEAQRPKRPRKKKAETNDKSSEQGNEKKENKPRASMTDPEARIMKMADGGFRPAYNVQFSSDPVSGATSGVSVDNIGSDKGKMAPMSDKIAKDYGQRPKEHLADGGFNKLEDVEALAEAGVTVYMPIKKSRKSRGQDCDLHAPKPKDSLAVAEWRKRMGTEEAKEIYKERAATAECVNAQARQHGLTQFVVRGTQKVLTCSLWYALTHNMMCSWRLLEA
jgi:transposase